MLLVIFVSYSKIFCEILGRSTRYSRRIYIARVGTDFNYLVNEDLTTEEVLELSKKNDLEELTRNYQLNMERQAGRVFKGFEEGPITFKPTYKYQPGTDHYDERPDKKRRVPAWCDRIFWVAKDFNCIHQLSYLCSELTISDHCTFG